MPDRKLFKLGVALAGPLLVACAAENTQSSPKDEPQYVDAPQGQLVPEQTPPQNPEPVINQSNGNTVITEGGKTYELRPQITIDQLLQTASLLSVRAPQASMVQTHIYSAKQKWEINPHDPLVSEDINKAAYLLFSYSQICQDPQAGVGGVARGFAQDAASYLHENDPEFWEDHKSLFVNGPCDWSKEESDALVGAEPTDPEPENTRSSIVIHSGDYEYKLYTDVTLDEVIVNANSLPQTSTKPQIVEKLQILRGVLEKNPDNDVYLFLLEEVHSINSGNCVGEKSLELTKQVASWLKQRYPEKYDTGSALFERGPCSVIKEVRAIAPRENQGDNPIIGLEGQLIFQEKDYSYYSLFPEATLDLLLGEPTTDQGTGILQFLKDYGYINQQAEADIRSLLRAAKQKELANPQDPAIIKDVNSAANILNVHCFDHDNNGLLTKIYMKYLASHVYLKNPPDWQIHKRIYLDGNCTWTKT